MNRNIYLKQEFANFIFLVSSVNNNIYEQNNFIYTYDVDVVGNICR